MKVQRFNESLDDYKSKIKIDLMKILDHELYRDHFNEIATDGKRCAINEIIIYLEKEGFLNETVIDAKKYNL